MHDIHKILGDSPYVLSPVSLSALINIKEPHPQSYVYTWQIYSSMQGRIQSLERGGAYYQNVE